MRFGRKQDVLDAVTDGTNKMSAVADAVPSYANQFATDVRSQLAGRTAQLQELTPWRKKKRRHRTRNVILLLVGVGAASVAVLQFRDRLLRATRRAVDRRPGRGDAGWTNIQHEIEVDVPVRTAYDQWTQFEEFPRFMDGVDDVRQIDDTLLHWTATVAGRQAEWDAKITDQEPNRRIAWESISGKPTRGAVTFEQAGSARTRIKLDMAYAPQGAAEEVGSAVGLDTRRVRGDLERFRELIEASGTESGAWRDTIEDGEVVAAKPRKKTPSTPES